MNLASDLNMMLIFLLSNNLSLLLIVFRLGPLRHLCLEIKVAEINMDCGKFLIHEQLNIDMEVYVRANSTSFLRQLEI